MRFSLVFTASAASASLLRRQTFGDAPQMPDSAFPKFETVTLEDAKAGLDRLIQGLVQPLNLTGDAPVESKEPETSNFRVMAATAQSAQSDACRANPNIRFEWREYSDSDRLAFVRAVKCLMNKPPSGNFPPARSRYEDFVRIHQDYMPNVHNNAKFLIWHRYYLWTFEQVLRSECGFDRAMVWWDETKDAGRFGQSDMFTNPAYFGSMPARDANGNPTCINDGEFAGLIANIGPGNSQTSHCLARGVNEADTAQCNTDFINYCNQRTSYADYESCLEYGPHGYGHNGIGGVMADVWASPSDPVFWMHHSFIDHSWRIWQNLDGNRILNIDGVDAAGNALTLDTMVYMGGIRPDVRVRDIIDTLGGVSIGGVPFCYRYTY
ncbi:hypothetical protein JX265_000365 [Neoarthrinium moseri]|uniref:Tyrosinase copper-binding domain-containing protein n=1 Tax=Neoarthrinium moseri TaxID=1658444 RepID=A0A9P9WYE5_9PEZI|nr:uncharacterized protein JN550_000615 [Neoarthrinium moseri]KAI1851401.1 hypothetical protein JX266_003476 [Neoarthrinium moseri]KAI1878433.1 hypothetical protein JN550_000615 [Neoarthrinium moseri]KAI1881539.1 hypothetical protein JX265_000365 [Neoarthrinium moseri]